MRRLMLGLAIAAFAAVLPGMAQADDQAIAQHIMTKLRAEQDRGNLKGFHVDMRVDQGTVWYQGFVSTQAQKDLVLRTAQLAHPLGVVQVVDDIDIRTPPESVMVESSEEMDAEVAPVAAVDQQMVGQQMVDQQMMIPSSRNMPNPDVRTQPIGWGQEPAPANVVMPTPHSQAPVAIDYQQAPLAVNAGGMGCACGQGVPGDNAMMPAYAWPSYAAYPNYGALTYPRQYSPTAWPYIGPFYPYPQVPLGWRKVSLEWDDGWWFLDFHNR